MKTKRRKLLAFIICIIAIFVFLYYQNNSIVITEIEVYSSNIPDGFDGYRILQISDLHSKSFGKNQKHLVDKITKTAPDIVVVTGDSVDSRRYDEDACIDLFSQITKLAPVYFVTGNHEAPLSKFTGFEQKLKDIGVIVLRNDNRIIETGDDSLQIFGLDDPDFLVKDISLVLDDLSKDIASPFTILLSHRPELIDLYAKYSFDLIFSGHAHGGQFRLPFIGGFYAPGQGIFPEYTSGIHRIKDSIMIISRGLGNSIFPQRIFNRPEIVVAVLKKQ